jgi:hypothetical protein
VLTTLLSLPSLVAFDIDEEGRLLVGYDGAGVRQLHEVGVDGSWRALTQAGERAVNAKYVPGTRKVVLERDTGGNEQGQLSILDLDGDAEPVPFIEDPEFFHHVIEARADQVLYTTNRRNNVDFDLVARDLPTGADTVLYDGGGYLNTIWPSPDTRWVLLIKASGPANSYQALLVDTETAELTELTGYDDQVYIHPASGWPTHPAYSCPATSTVTRAGTASRSSGTTWPPKPGRPCWRTTTVTCTAGSVRTVNTCWSPRARTARSRWRCTICPAVW